MELLTSFDFEVNTFCWLWGQLESCLRLTVVTLDWPAVVMVSTASSSAYALSPTVLRALTEKLYVVAGCRPVTVKDASPTGNTSAYRKPGERSQRYLPNKRFNKGDCVEAPFSNQRPLLLPNLMRNLCCRPPLNPGIHSRVTESWVKSTWRNEVGGSG